MADEKLRGERNMGLFVVGFLALNFPLLSLFGKGVTVFGVPLLYAYLFALWLALIVLTFVTLRRRPADVSSPDKTAQH